MNPYCRAFSRTTFLNPCHGPPCWIPILEPSGPPFQKPIIDPWGHLWTLSSLQSGRHQTILSLTRKTPYHIRCKFVFVLNRTLSFQKWLKFFLMLECIENLWIVVNYDNVFLMKNCSKKWIFLMDHILITCFCLLKNKSLTVFQKNIFLLKKLW